MKIVEYSNDIAALVADMWNKSGSNWGNDDSVRTAQDVIEDESKSGNLKLYIAIDNGEAVGYCSFSEYEHDEGASYLPLLNVRPDYHGKKVGKALILKVIEDAIKAPWPRFDLFTWSGNIKAMPLYKKCGFFWEKNNESVHLMNFLPYLYQTPAFKEQLDNLNWYQDSKRVIDMNQDGREEKGFDFFRYHFENDQTLLITEFEKSGRGLRYIETNDYSIEMIIPDHKLIYNQTYDVEFKVVNKSGKALNIDIKGYDNKNISQTFEESFEVEGVYGLKRQFTVNKTDKTYDKWDTHPVVECDVVINGLKSVFKLGVETLKPVSLKLQLPEYNHILNTSYKGYLDVENNMNEAQTFRIELPNTYIEVNKPLEVTLQSKEKRSLSFEYNVKEFGYINEDAVIKYNDKEIGSDVKAIVKGHYDILHVEDEHAVFLIDGNYTIKYDKTHNRVGYSKSFDSNGETGFMTPKIGLPYNLEFSNLKAEFSYPKENILKSVLKSEAFKDVELHIYVESSRGICKTHFELINNGEEKELALSLPLWKVFNDTYVPYKGGILEMTNKEGGGPSSLETKYIDENWLYSNKSKVGFTWHKDHQIMVSGWRFASAKEEIVLKQGESYKTKEFITSFVHSDMKSFRKFAGHFDEKNIIKFITLHINKGNPFVDSNVDCTLENLRMKKLEGTISCDGEKVDVSKTLHLSPGLKDIVLDTKDRIIKQKRLLLKKEGTITCSQEDTTFKVHNGLLEYKVDNAYSDAVISLVYNGSEWLDSNYPDAKERAWWGRFAGGINTRHQDIQDVVALEEPRTTEFVTLKDNFNNEWTGIKASLRFEKDEDFKGYIFDSYYLTLPGVPVLYTFTNITNNSGKYIHRKFFTRYNVLQLDDTNTKASYTVDGITYKCGDVGIEKSPKKFVQYESSREDKLAIYNKDNIFEADTQTAYTILFSEKRLSIADRTSKQLSGDFYIFTKEELKKEYLIDLENIKFEV